MSNVLGDLVWNRAVLEGGGLSPRAGDAALASLTRVHGVIMNGGVLHAIEVFGAADLLAADHGYRHFGLEAAADVLLRAKQCVAAGAIPEDAELAFDEEYANAASDEAIEERLQEHLLANPAAFAPVGRA